MMKKVLHFDAEQEIILTDRRYYYDLLRIILVLLVVVGHGTYYNVITKFGGIHYADLMNEHSINQPTFYKVMTYLTNYIYTFHMPVFMALSGSVYALSREKPLKILISQKAKHLLIPFFIVWLFWNVPIKFFTGYYEGISIISILLQMIFPKDVYLWYLESLFFVFVLFGIIQKAFKRSQSIVVFGAWVIGVILFKKLSQYHPFGDPLYYLGWFYLGYRVDDLIMRLKQMKLWNKVSMQFLIVFQIAMVLFDTCLRNFKIFNAGCKYIFFPLSMLVILNYFVRAINLRDKRIEIVSGYGMGVYLYADPLNYLLLYLFYTYNGIEYFGTNVGSAMIYFSRILITPLVAFFITWVLKKLNLKYLY